MGSRREQRSLSRSDGSCTTPELLAGSSSQFEEESVATTVNTPMLVTEGDQDALGVDLAHTDPDWDVFAHDMGAFLSEHTQPSTSFKEARTLPSAANTLPWQGSPLSLASTPQPAPAWLGPSRRASCEAERPKRAKQPRTRPPERTLPTYAPPALLAMDPHPLPQGPRSEALRAWLLERRALLQKTHEDISRDMTRLENDRAALAQLHTRVTQRVEHLRRTLLASPETQPVYDMAALLEQDILCL